MLCEVLRTSPNRLIYGLEDPFDDLIEQARWGGFASTTPEYYAMVLYAFSRLHHHNQQDIMRLMNSLLLGWDEEWKAGKQYEKANKLFLDIADSLRVLMAKTFTTFFFPVGDEVREIVADWEKQLREVMLWGNDEPLFPATRIAVGVSRQFEVVGLERNHWSSASPIRSISKDAFEGAGLPYFNPHSFRHTLARLGETVCQTPEQFKAWSQNLGHEGVLTTFYSYGDVSVRRQGELIQGLGKPQASQAMTVEDMAEAVVRKMREADANTSARTAI